MCQTQGHRLNGAYQAISCDPHFSPAAMEPPSSPPPPFLSRWKQRGEQNISSRSCISPCRGSCLPPPTISAVGSRGGGQNSSYRSCASLCSRSTSSSPPPHSQHSAPLVLHFLLPSSTRASSQQQQKVRWVHCEVREGLGVLTADFSRGERH